MSHKLDRWLETLGFGKYSKAFAQHQIDYDILPYLTIDDLRDIGVFAVGDRHRLLLAIRAYSERPGVSEATVDQRSAASRRQVTVLFSDISDFTHLSSTLDAEETHTLLNNYFATVDEIIKRYDGAVDKHIGDAVMAVFGAPIAHTNDPERALRAAEEIHRSLDNVKPPIKVHIGIATGQVVASSTGSTTHTEYTVTGDSVNLAARLTDLANAEETLVSAAVQRAVGDLFVGEALGEQMVEGLPEPVSVWRLDHIAHETEARVKHFVGRKRELSRFEGAVTHCLEEGVGETLVVRGDAGIGKTQLAMEVQRRAITKGFSTHTSLILEFGAGKGQDAIRVLVRSILSIAPGSSEQYRSNAMERVVNDGWIRADQRVFLNDLLDLPQPADLQEIFGEMDNTTRGQGRRETLATLVQAKSQRDPVILLIESVHLATPLIKSYISQLAQTVAGCRAILVMTMRPSGDDQDDPWLAELAATSTGMIDLGSLTKDEMSELSQHFGAVQADIRENCMKRSGGNPLFLEQLLVNAVDLRADNIPETLQGIIQARLDAMPENDRRAIQAAAVLGQRFNLEALQAVLSDPDFQMDGLIAQGLIRALSGSYLVENALVLEGAYASLLGNEREAMHAKAADWFEYKDAILYAEHLGRGGADGASRAFLSAAFEQKELLRFDTAINLGRRGLDHGGDPTVLFGLLFLMGDASKSAGRVDEAIANFSKAIAIAPDNKSIGTASTDLAELLSDRPGNAGTEALELLKRAESIADSDDDKIGLSRIYCIRGMTHHSRGDVSEALSAFQKSLHFAERKSDPLLQAQALAGLSVANYGIGRFVSCEKIIRQMLDLASANGFKREEVIGHYRLGITRLYNGSAQECVTECNKTIELASPFGMPRILSLANEYKARALMEMGEFAPAKKAAQQSLNIAREIGAEVRTVLANIHLARLGIVYGDINVAREHAEDAVQQSRASAPRFALPWSLITLADCHEDAASATHLHEEALNMLRAEECTSHNYFHVYATMIEHHLSQGDWDEAENFANLLGEYTSSETINWCHLIAERGRALANAGRGNGSKASLEELTKKCVTMKLSPYIARLEEALA